MEYVNGFADDCYFFCFYCKQLNLQKFSQLLSSGEGGQASNSFPLRITCTWGGGGGGGPKIACIFAYIRNATPPYSGEPGVVGWSYDNTMGPDVTMLT